MRPPRPILVVEDDPDVATTIANALTRDGWTVVTASTLAEGRAQLRQADPCIAVVDLGLPDGNGIAFVRESAFGHETGIIVLSGRSDEVDRVVGLEVGADDYLTKPFSPRELVARVRALSRRINATRPAAAPIGAKLGAPQSWELGGVQLEPARQRMLAACGTETHLTGAEAGLLNLLLTEPENLAAREMISERVLGRRLLPEQRGVDQLASNLRQKLHEASAGCLTLTAVRGRGYRLVW